MSRYGINTAAMEGILAFESRSKNAIHTCTRLALLEVGRRLVEYSVVGDPSLWKHKPHKGYRPGLFANSWQVGIDARPASIATRPDQSGSGSLERLSHLGRWPAYHTYHFANNLPYAAALEYGGHSLQVPPLATVGRVELEFPQIVQLAIQQYHSGIGDVTDKNQVSSAFGG